MATSSGQLPKAGDRRLGLNVLGAYRLFDDADSPILIASSGSVIDFEGDAIVNAANEGCIMGAGVDGAISQAGGRALQEARQQLPLIKPGVRCQTGDAVITIGGELKARFCIHAVGPIYFHCTLDEGDALVTSAYQAALSRAQEKGLSSVAFSLISGGIFRGNQSLSKVLTAGVDGIKKGKYPELEEVHIVAFTPEERQTLRSVCDELCGAGSNASQPQAASKERCDKGEEEPLTQQSAETRPGGWCPRRCPQRA